MYAFVREWGRGVGVEGEKGGVELSLPYDVGFQSLHPHPHLPWYNTPSILIPSPVPAPLSTLLKPLPHSQYLWGAGKGQRERRQKKFKSFLNSCLQRGHRPGGRRAAPEGSGGRERAAECRVGTAGQAGLWSMAAAQTAGGEGEAEAGRNRGEDCVHNCGYERERER